jgi:pimeloyl-ACP methyl ester carboxylesterase
MNRRAFNAVLLWFAAQGSRVMGMDPAEAKTATAPDAGTGLFNLQLPTLGGMQLWQDELLFHSWRIQRNVLTGYYRLLDDRDWRVTWGSFEACQAKLDEIKRDRSLPPLAGKVVLLVHGLVRTRGSMNNLGKYLADRGQYDAMTVGYPSTRASVGQHARGLASVIDHLDGVEEINFVAHSLGNLVIRHYLADHTDPQTLRQGDPRIKRIVMLGPPNNGAQLAEALGQNSLFEFIIGESGQQLARGWADLEKELATPACEFGVIAGGRGDGKGFNPLVKGDDDLIVAVESARLPGAADFLVLPVRHTFMMDQQPIQEATLSFLEHGYFVSAEKRQPIPRP